MVKKNKQKSSKQTPVSDDVHLLELVGLLTDLYQANGIEVTPASLNELMSEFAVRVTGKEWDELISVTKRPKDASVTWSAPLPNLYSYVYRVRDVMTASMQGPLRRYRIAARQAFFQAIRTARREGISVKKFVDEFCGSEDEEEGAVAGVVTLVRNSVISAFASKFGASHVRRMLTEQRDGFSVEFSDRLKALLTQILHLYGLDGKQTGEE